MCKVTTGVHQLFSVLLAKRPRKAPLASAYRWGCYIVWLRIAHMCLRCVYTFLCGSLMFNSHLLHNWVSEWIFSTLMEAAGLEDQLLPGSRDDMTAAGSDGQAPRVYQMFSCALPKILLCSACLALWSWWASHAAAAAAAATTADSWGGARRVEMERVQRCKSKNGDLRRG